MKNAECKRQQTEQLYNQIFQKRLVEENQRTTKKATKLKTEENQLEWVRQAQNVPEGDSEAQGP